MVHEGETAVGGAMRSRGRRAAGDGDHRILLVLNIFGQAMALDVLKAAEPYAIQRTELVGTYHR